jgi:hypothetical protein
MSDFKKRKQIEQARMAGQLAPETDTETGKMINPHNPDFISKRPWYLGDSGPSLKHHRYSTRFFTALMLGECSHRSLCRFYLVLMST